MLSAVPTIVTAKTGPDTTASATRQPMIVTTSTQKFGRAVTA